MKKLIVLTLLIISILLSSCTKLCVLNPSTITMPDDLEFLAVVKQLDTPEKIANYMTNNFTYKIHDFYKPSPYTLWQIKEGDCNDFSTFSAFVANYHGYETYQIVIFDSSPYSHVVSVFNENNYCSIIDNKSYYRSFNGFQNIVEFICYKHSRIWTKYIVTDYSMNTIEHKTKPPPKCFRCNNVIGHL